ncbi:VOC family protein [Streptomyces sp. NRRL F-2799]|uniref:VOC family protein n=1 Tax=Streptomyces sp. NRRL F-2799 TaxID=1463844 RepID=UPI0004CA63A2|nr:VOC family protein [Streptomyces sp. NRRL F-2799]
MALAELGAIVLDCPDPETLAGFYAEILGGTTEGDADWVDLRTPAGQTVAFQRAPDHVPPAWPSPDAPQQFHLDLTVPDLDEAEKQILTLGAKPLDTDAPTRNWRVYADPAGHPFCLCAC